MCTITLYPIMICLQIFELLKYFDFGGKIVVLCMGLTINLRKYIFSYISTLILLHLTNNIMHILVFRVQHYCPIVLTYLDHILTVS